ncbi:MAG TPA: hypothetical protein VFE47_23530 [Tepidisphaeraceae bacterium]|jgi:hypothetical protein|nr:hypothetical protein [Tepidisphaeraceae bacterium]
MPAPAVALAQTAAHVVAATADGSVFWFDRENGTVAGQMHAGGRLVAGASTRQGHVVVLAADGKLIGVNTHPQLLTVISVMPGANCVALADDGRTLVATPGRLSELDPSGRVLGNAKSPPLNALAWHATEGWFAAGGCKVQRYNSGRLKGWVKLPDDQNATHLAAGQAGVGVGTGAYFWLCQLADPPDPLLRVNYMKRLVTGISFGPQRWIGLSLNGGDGNKIDYVTGATNRSDTHPGRKHNSWLLTIWTPKQK